ncbi:MAG: Bacterial regulatory, luxR family protein [Caulobacteraceae bacterium]|jgi:DNA-binding CsgD family transcriptional regulator|nr:Bacterial regulatory, luxR family protein [Caulobacteraceae bacterium]
MDNQALTRTGIDPVGDLAWGAHICLFYETPEDLIETHAAYFRAGLANNEFCLWVLSDPLSRDEAIEGLRPLIPEFDRHLAAGNIELVPGYKWYLRGGEVDPQRITGGWTAKLDDALARGFTGMRGSGNAFWLETNLWDDFKEYEAELNGYLEGKKMVVLCTYPLYATRSVDVLDVAHAHHFAIARRQGRWEVLKARELREMNPPTSAVDALSSAFRGQEHLTPRERVILAQIVKGASSKESARYLGISPRTVEFHRANIMQKLGARNIAVLVRKILSE